MRALRRKVAAVLQNIKHLQLCPPQYPDKWRNRQFSLSRQKRHRFNPVPQIVYRAEYVRELLSFHIEIRGSVLFDRVVESSIRRIPDHPIVQTPSLRNRATKAI